MTAPALVDGYEVVIGFETHVQLSTATKIFSRSSTAFGAPPNTQASAGDLALPGALPVMNRQAVVCAMRLGLALGAHIAPQSSFDRKHYFYPDLPSGYQISQFYTPIVQGGAVTFELDGQQRSTRLVRAHLEEDAGKSLHDAFDGHTGIDLNRAGMPLLEIVTEPDMRSAEEAVAYARQLHRIVTWIGICDGNMQEGSFRCDANVSVRRPGAPLGVRREIKNLNSFRFMRQAIDYEIRWQIGEIEDGHVIRQATALFDPDSGETRAMRLKEDSDDYRYFPDPDLPPLHVSAQWLAEVREQMPELPGAMAERLVREHGLSGDEAAEVTHSRQTAAFFEQAVAAGGPPRRVCHWVTGELTRALNDEGLAIEASRVSAAQLARLLERVEDGTISNSAARQVFEHLWRSGGEVDAAIDELGLKQITDTAAIEKLVDEVIAASPSNVEQFKAGKDKALNALVGRVMQATRGKADPKQVSELLRQRLQS